MVSFTYDKDTRIVEVDLPDTELDIQDLYDNIKDWEDELDNFDVYKLIDGAGKQELGGGVSVGITLTLLGWRVKFADRPGPDWVVCDVAGGNLVCVTGTDDEIKNMSGVSYINPIAPAAYVTVTKTSSSSATLASQSALQYSTYGGGVTINRSFVLLHVPGDLMIQLPQATCLMISRKAISPSPRTAISPCSRHSSKSTVAWIPPKTTNTSGIAALIALAQEKARCDSGVIILNPTTRI